MALNAALQKCNIFHSVFVLFYNQDRFTGEVKFNYLVLFSEKLNN